MEQVGWPEAVFYMVIAVSLIGAIAAIIITAILK